MAKRVLFLVSPSFYFLTGYRLRSFSHKYIPSSSFFLASQLAEKGYEVDLYELDAKLMAHFEGFEHHIDNCNALFFQQAFLEHLKGLRREEWLDQLFEKLTEGMEGYDYILCSNIRNPTFEIPVRAGNYFTILLFERLSKLNPQAERICGGLRSQYLDAKAFADFGIDLKQYLDLIVMAKIPFSSIHRLLEEKKVVSSSFLDFTGSYHFEPAPLKMADPPLDYPLPQPVLRNGEDLTYSMERIFSDLDLTPPVPVEKLKGKYIKQMELHYIGGCSSKCAFCSTGSAKLSISQEDHVFETMKRLIYDQGINAFFFENATLNSNKKMVEKLCNWIVSRNLKIYWSDSCRLSGNGPDFYKMLYEAGARMLCFGADSGSDRMLQYIQKGTNIDEMQRELEWSHQAGIWNLVNFIAGLPYETNEDINLTFDFLEANQKFINTFKYNIFHLEHVSPFYSNPEKFNLHIPEKNNPDRMERIKEGIALDEAEFEEIGGRNYQEINEFRKHAKNQIGRVDHLKEQGFKTHIGQHLLFALYDLLGTKDQVEDWLFKNFRKGRKAYYNKNEAFQRIEKWPSSYLLESYFAEENYTPLFPSIVFKHIDHKTEPHKQV